MSILITGANGYLGKELINWLSRFYSSKIYALDRNWLEEDISPIGVEKIRLSLEDIKPQTKLVRGARIKMIVHLAAKVLIDTSSTSANLDLMAENCLNLVKLLDWAVANRVEKFIFISSMTVYAPAKTGTVQNENSPKDPQNFYGLSKFFGEEIVKLYSKQAGIRSIVLRLPGLYGKQRESGLIYNLATKICSGEKVVLDLKGLKNWETIHVSDAASVIGRIMKGHFFGQPFNVFNIGYGDRRVAIDPIIKLIGEHYNKTPKVKIKNVKEYSPSFMRVAKLRKYLTGKRLSFSRSLKEYLRTIQK